VRLFEWQSLDFSKHKNVLPDFISYLSTVWQNRNRYNEIDEDLSEEEIRKRQIARQRFFDFTYDDKIVARNYIGVVQYEDIRVEVYPKIFSKWSSPDWSQIQFNILFWLSYCRKISFPFALANVANIDFDNFLEVLIFIFANYSSEILTEQPYQSYQEITEEMSFLKGRLSFPDYINSNLSTGNWQNFYCTHEPFVFDNQFNRIVKHLTKKLYGISSNALNKSKLSNIMFLLDEVSDVSCNLNDCDKVKLNNLYTDHENILSLCRLFLSNSIFDIQDDGSKNFCFLIPMEYIFEEFTFGFLTEHYTNITVKSQSTSWLATRLGTDVFKIRNDLIINNKLIIDTKYKIRALNDGLKAGVSQNDMYQMLAYALKRKCIEVILLYPYSEVGNNETAEFEIKYGDDGKAIKVIVKNIDITFKNDQQAVAKLKAEFGKVSVFFEDQ
jgi:5-methylcytosine-specific restriction enzyme subunit McrC